MRDTYVGRDAPTRLMAVVNVSSESFFAGSVVAPESIDKRVRLLERQGAEIIDIGGASSAPTEIYGTEHISVEEELKRIQRAMRVARDATDLPISIDTSSADVARLALDLGADMVNDITGLKGDPQMAPLVVREDVPVVIMASCNGPCQDAETTWMEMKRSLELAAQAGIDDDKIVIDPGIGFGRPPDEDFRLIRELPMFCTLGHPVLVGVSRKAFIGSLLNHPNPEDRLIGSVAVTSVAVANGADIIRTHDVEETREAIQIGLALRRPEIRNEETVLLDNVEEPQLISVLERIGVDPEIRGRLTKKSVMLNLLIGSVATPAALVIKQEMLALGGDAAYHRDVIDCRVSDTTLLIVGTPLQLEKLGRRLRKMNYFGLPRIAEQIRYILEKREERAVVPVGLG